MQLKTQGKHPLQNTKSHPTTSIKYIFKRRRKKKLYVLYFANIFKDSTKKFMAQSIFQMTSTPENMHLQLDELALQLLMLCQNLGGLHVL